MSVSLRVVFIFRWQIGRLGLCHLKILQRQFQLFDLAFDLFRAGTKLLFLQLGNPDAQRLNHKIMRAQCGRHLLIFRLQLGNHRLQNGGIIGKRNGII